MSLVAPVARAKRRVSSRRGVRISRNPWRARTLRPRAWSAARRSRPGPKRSGIPRGARTFVPGLDMVGEAPGTGLFCGSPRRGLRILPPRAARGHEPPQEGAPEEDHEEEGLADP